MNKFDRHVRDYLTMRRALGFKLRREGQVLTQLAAYLEQAGAEHLNAELALRWAQLPQNVAPINWAHRLGAARGFAAYLKTIDPATEIPARGLLPATAPRPTPYLWSAEDVARLVRATGQLRPPLRAATYEALFGLIAASGIRLGEAIALDRDDVDLTEGLLTIREAKFGHTRLVPLHPTVTEALGGYAGRRDRLCPHPRSHTFFVSSIGTALLQGGVHHTFNQLTTDLGLRTATVRPPRSRSSAQLRRPHPDRLAPGRAEHRLTHVGAVDLPRARQPGRDLLVSVRLTAADGPGRGTAERPLPDTAMSKLAPTLQAYFTDRLLGQRQASPHTIAGYRDTFRLLLRFAADRTRTQACELDFADLDAPLIAAFLTHLETERGNGVRTRNHRLAAIHSLFSYAALHHPEHAASIQRVLAIPPKRFERNLVIFLTDDEVDALLTACDRSTWTGRRDHAMITLAIQTGLRISELTGLTCTDVVLAAGAHVRCLGKGRKQRHTPLLPLTVDVLRIWLAERHGSPSDPLFPTTTGRPMSRDAIERRISHHIRAAAQACPSLRTKKVSAHTLRHTAAMRLLLSGVDVTVIALWLGHEQVTTTNVYLHADMSQKERAIARTTPLNTTPGRYRAPDTLLAFLEAL